jgi:hypothetical protein
VLSFGGGSNFHENTWWEKDASQRGIDYMINTGRLNPNNPVDQQRIRRYYEEHPSKNGDLWEFATLPFTFFGDSNFLEKMKFKYILLLVGVITLQGCPKVTVSAGYSESTEVGEGLDYSNKYAKEFSDNNFGRVKGLNELHADNTLHPLSKYKVDGDYFVSGSTRANALTTYLGTGKGSNVYPTWRKSSAGV